MGRFKFEQTEQKLPVYACIWVISRRVDRRDENQGSEESQTLC
jgi:hypothetical protein